MLNYERVLSVLAVNWTLSPFLPYVQFDFFIKQADNNCHTN